MNKLLLTNVVYSEPYANLFLEQHLPSMLDETNIPTHKDRLQYLIYTDSSTRKIIESHPNFIKLNTFIHASCVEFVWPQQMNQYAARYNILVQVFREAVNITLSDQMWLSFLVADLVMAKGFLSKMFHKLDNGYDAVLGMPMRASSESMTPLLSQVEGALSPIDLFELSYQHMHPLFLINHYKSPTFTWRPFYIIWNTGRGLLLRSYSVTPIVLKPNKKMLNVRSTIDEEVPSYCENPYLATDWIDCPFICCEFLKCMYPGYSNAPIDVQKVKEWSKRLHPTQVARLQWKLYYPSKDIAKSPNRLEELESDMVVHELTR